MDTKVTVAQKCEIGVNLKKICKTYAENFKTDEIKPDINKWRYILKESTY